AQDHRGGEGALDDGLEVSAIPRTPPRVSRLASLKARGDRWVGVANRPAGGAAIGAGREPSIGQPLPTVVCGLTPASGGACSSHLSHLSVPVFGSQGRRIRPRCGRGLLACPCSPASA